MAGARTAAPTRKEKTMSENSFTTTITVDRTPEEAFAAINNVRGWWSGEIEGTTDKLGGEFTYRYQDMHRSRQKITELVPGKKVVWRVSDSYLQFVKDKAEWDGTNIVFDIARKGGKTEVRFTHRGLAPEYECFDKCSGAWGFYIAGSLRDLIEAGKGQPNKKGQ
jgi:Activator of Hsp90 ATPase homolog 1-like protein